MTLQFVQPNMLIQADSYQKSRSTETYRDSEKVVKTKKKVKPLPPQGHLIDDNIVSGTKYFFKDIDYDLKSIKNGYLGTANDHQLGRLNDVGLRLGSIGIATYLATQTTNPKARLMEYIGLAIFLTSMSIYPKIAINTPARIIHGYDINKEYIDDQGRKKSVHQDSNYVPYDMYNGKNKGEDLESIGDKMGIPSNIKNRNDVTREQMRKIATQNNTLWMLTAGFATPLMTALLCNCVERFIVTPSLEKTRNLKYDSQIRSLLSQVPSGDVDLSKVNNSLGDSIKRIMSKYDNKLLPNNEVEIITSLITEDIDTTLAIGIKEDIKDILSRDKAIIIDKENLGNVIANAHKTMRGTQTNYIIENILPSQNDIELMIKEIKPEADLKIGVKLSHEEFVNLQTKILDYANKKTNVSDNIIQKHRDYINSNVIKFKNAFEFEEYYVITQKSAEDMTKLANIIGDFKKKNAILDKCANFKFEYTPESILANYYDKFQKTLIKQLGISPKDFKRMSNDSEYTKQILDKKFAELCKDESKFKLTFEKLGKVLSDMETSLHGKAEEFSQIADLINGIENVYNSTAKTLTDIGIGKATADKLVKGDSGYIQGKKDNLYKFLDGTFQNEFAHKNPDSIDSLKYYANGKGSSKNLKISRIINRYQGGTNSFFRIFHTIDFYKRACKLEELSKLSSVKDKTYIEKIIKNTKDALLNGSISDFILKLGIENKFEYRDLYNIGWALEPENYGQINQKGVITDSAKEALEKNKSGNIIERLQLYISRFKNIIANDRTDFTKPEHILDINIPENYTDMVRSNEAKFNLVAQSPVDMLQKASGRMHADRMWLKRVGILTGIVFGITLVAQFGFGKIKNKHNLQVTDKTNSNTQKQVKNDSK